MLHIGLLWMNQFVNVHFLVEKDGHDILCHWIIIFVIGFDSCNNAVQRIHLEVYNLKFIIYNKISIAQLCSRTLS